MLGQLLALAGCVLEIITDTDSSLQVAEQVAEHSPSLVIVSHLPPQGLTLARYLVRRLRVQLPDMPIVVGRWGTSAGATSAVPAPCRQRCIARRVHTGRGSISDRCDGCPRKASSDRRRCRTVNQNEHQEIAMWYDVCTTVLSPVEESCEIRRAS